MNAGSNAEVHPRTPNKVAGQGTGIYFESIEKSQNP
jgi:hypothetical protein